MAIFQCIENNKTEIIKQKCSKMEELIFIVSVFFVCISLIYLKDKL